VVYDADKCIGCRYCMLACPYQVPRYQWSKLAPFVKKCDFCAERLKASNQPACTEACPVQASVFGDRDELIAEAWNRIRTDSSYVPRIYGVQEAGGGSVLFVSDVEFEKLGFKPAADRQSAGANADGRGYGRFAQGRDYGRNNSVCSVLDHAEAPRSCAGRSGREGHH
jgi:Fe-S-cluster-containing dehydrogenase component